MLKFIKPAAVAALLSVTVVAPGFSQTVDTSVVIAACVPVEAIEAECLAAIDAFVASLSGLTAAQVNAALGVLAGALATASLEAGRNSPVIAAGLGAIAAAVTDPAQSAQILRVAASVGAGSNIAVFAVGGATPASPN